MAERPVPGTDAIPAGAAGGESGRQVGWRGVLIVAAIAAGVVLGASILTSVLPTDLQRVIFHTPLLIAVLIAGTALILWRIAARRPPDT